MPRLRNAATGVVVNVRDGKVLDGYKPVEKPEPKPAPKKSSSK